MPELPETWRCRDCEAMIEQEWDLCEDCHSDWIGWLIKNDDASSFGHIPYSAVAHPNPE